MQRTFTTAFLPYLSTGRPAQAPQRTTPRRSGAPAPAFEVAKDLAARDAGQGAGQLDLLAARPRGGWCGTAAAASYFTNKSSSRRLLQPSKAADQDPNDRESIEMRGVSLFRWAGLRGPSFLEKAHTRGTGQHRPAVCTGLV